MLGNGVRWPHGIAGKNSHHWWRVLNWVASITQLHSVEWLKPLSMPPEIWQLQGPIPLRMSRKTPLHLSQLHWAQGAALNEKKPLPPQPEKSQLRVGPSPYPWFSGFLSSESKEVGRLRRTKDILVFPCLRIKWIEWNWLRALGWNPIYETF